jgi:hypothetical protein
LLALNHFTVPCSLIDLRPSSFFKLFVPLDRLQEIKAASLNLPFDRFLKVHKSDKRVTIVTCPPRRNLSD